MKGFALLIYLLGATLAKGSELPVLMKDGDYTLTIISVAEDPSVQFPHSPIPVKDYKPAHEKENLQLHVSHHGAKIRIVPLDAGGHPKSEKVKAPKDGVILSPYLFSGKLQSKAADAWVYATVADGLGDAATFVLKQTKQGLVATYTAFGSGRPILWSYRGLVTDKSTKAEHGGVDQH